MYTIVIKLSRNTKRTPAEKFYYTQQGNDNRVLANPAPFLVCSSLVKGCSTVHGFQLLY